MVSLSHTMERQTRCEKEMPPLVFLDYLHTFVLQSMQDPTIEASQLFQPLKQSTYQPCPRVGPIISDPSLVFAGLL